MTTENTGLCDSSIITKIARIKENENIVFQQSKLRYIVEFENALDDIYVTIIDYLKKDQFAIIDNNTIRIAFKYFPKYFNVPFIHLISYYTSKIPTLSLVGREDSSSKSTYNYKYFFKGEDWNDYALKYIHNKYQNSSIIKNLALTDLGHWYGRYYCGYTIFATLSQ